METFETIRTALAVRKYKNKPVPPEVVRKIIDAGRLTGSARNSQPWHFIVIENQETLHKLGAMVHTGPYVAEAPLAIAVAVEKTRFALSDGSRAIQSMILAAWSEGIGSNWVGFQGMDEVRSLLGVPGDLDVIAILPFGYPAKTVGKGKKNRKPITEVAHRERFGQPFK